MKKTMIAIAALALASCGAPSKQDVSNIKVSGKGALSVGSTMSADQENEIQLRVEELVKYIPDRKLGNDAEQHFAPEFFRIISKAYSIPVLPGVDKSSGQAIPQFVECKAPCKGKDHKIVFKNISVDKNKAAADFEYWHSESSKDEHTMRLELVDGKWLISGWDDTKTQFLQYVNNNYRTPDLAFMELKGNVKSVVYKDLRKAYFDEDGNITEYKTAFASTHNVDEDGNIKSCRDNGNLPVNITRDGNGYIENIYEPFGASTIFTYDTELIMLKTEVSGEEGYYFERQYSFNKNFEPQVMFIEGSEMEGTENADGPYLIKVEGVDSHGNWTKRSFKDIKEERKIEYYD